MSQVYTKETNKENVLLVFHCNYVPPIFHRFRDIITYFPICKEVRDFEHIPLAVMYNACTNTPVHQSIST